MPAAYVCEHPGCTGKHGHTGPREEWCPRTLERAAVINSGEDVGDNEVRVRPGLCVAWTASEGHCGEPADGLACVKHAEDFAPLEAHRTRLTAEDMAWLATQPEGERSKAQKRLSMKRAREDPEYKDKQDAHRRVMRAAGNWKS